MKIITIAVLCLTLFGPYGEARGQAAAPAASAAAFKPEKFLRTELYFGRSMPDRTLISDDDWKSFLAETVTPLFPDGFTVMTAFGQYRGKDGRVIAEPSQVLIILYPGRSKRESGVKIEQIRVAYINRFAQESVLRVDLPKSVRVAF